MKVEKYNIYPVGIATGKNREDEEPISKEIMAENFPEMNKEISHQVYGSHEISTQ